MATPQDRQAQIDAIEVQIQQIRNTKYRDEPFAAKNDPEILGLRAQQNQLRSQNVAAAPNNPNTDAYEGPDRNSGQGVYVNAQTGERYIGPVKETPQTQVTTQQNAEDIATATGRGPVGSVSNTTVADVGGDDTYSAVNTQTNQTAQTNSTASESRGVDAPVDPNVDPQAFGGQSDTGEIPGVTVSDREQTDPGFVPSSFAQPVDRFSAVYNSETGLYDVYNLDTGQKVREGLTQQQAILEEQDLSAGATIGENERIYNPTAGSDPQAGPRAAGLADTNTQAALQELRKKALNDDWRFRIKLAPNANYLYAVAGASDILYPLKQSNGVIFPYTPTISTSYRANYDTYDLTHTNYRGYFYKNSSVGEISVQGMFTANSSSDADYMLAVIHFFRSVTKMFYGQDTEQAPGTPPPVVYIRGMGKYQFNEHPCLVSNFSYNLPGDVDYIRAGSAAGAYSGGAVNLSQIRNQQGSASGGTIWDASKQRLISSIIDFVGGGQRSLPAGGQFSPQVSSGQYKVSGQPTYVPTKLNISLTLLPLVSRRQQAQDFSLRDFAKGELLSNKGFW